MVTGCASNYAADYKEITSTIDPEASCNEMWKQLWPKAKTGNHAARDLIAGLIAMRGLMAPGMSTDDNWIYTYTTLVMHEDMLEGTEELVEMKMAALQHNLINQPYGNLVASCFEHANHDNAEAQKCVDMAGDYKIIQPYDVFVESVEAHWQLDEKVMCVDEMWPNPHAIPQP
jgi:hypothetical protein